MTKAVVKQITLYPLAVPLRRKVSHAAGERAVADPVVVAVEFTGGGGGYGETLPRPYVTGETPESVIRAIRGTLVPVLLDFRAESFVEALEAIDALPWRDEAGRGIPAARAAVELALLDACSRHFAVDMEAAARWAGLAGFGGPGSADRLRYSGVLASSTLAGTMKWLRLSWWYGLRDFKLKVGTEGADGERGRGGEGDEEKLRAVYQYLERAIARGRATLRVDANGAWSREEAIERLGDWQDIPLASVEQPLAKGHESDLPLLKDILPVSLMHDESLVTLEDGLRLIDLGVADGFNIRLSKCGGFLPSLRLAHLARRHGAVVQLGCMVGETSILSAAGRRFLELVPGVRFAEGWYGSFLMRDDVVRKGLRFGYGGRGRPLSRRGWGIEVDPARLDRLATRSIVVELG